VILDYLARFNGSEGRTSSGRLGIAVAKTSRREQPVTALSTLVPFGSLSVVEDFFDGLMPTSLREGMAEFVFAVFKSMLPFRYDS
jgi:hypothetical protein